MMDTNALLPETLEVEDDDASDPKFVTALARGLSILQSFRPNEIYLSNQVFALRTGLPKATVTRITYTLCVLGYLVQDAGGGEYRLGPGVLTLGFGMVMRMDLRDRVALELADICRQDNPNVAAALGERHGNSVVYLSTHRSPNSVSMTFHLGGQVPLFHTSIGRAILMGLPKERQEQLLEEVSSRVDPQERARLATSLTRAREDFDALGFCTSFGEWRKEINGIAAPFTAESGRVFGINVGGFAFLNTREALMEEYAPRLLMAVRNLGVGRREHD